MERDAWLGIADAFHRLHTKIAWGGPSTFKNDSAVDGFLAFNANRGNYTESYFHCDVENGDKIDIMFNKIIFI